MKDETKKLNSPKELGKGIYEIIPVHNVKESPEEVYSEYMNLNTNNGTIIYEKRLGFLMPSPDIMKISEYENLINKYGLNEVNGSKEFQKFIGNYPELYKIALENEAKENNESEENEL